MKTKIIIGSISSIIVISLLLSQTSINAPVLQKGVAKCSDLSDSGTGCTATSSGTNGITLIEQHTASNSATLSFPSCFTSTYDIYEIDMMSLLPASNNVSLSMQYTIDNGANWLTTNDYAYNHAFWQSNSTGTGFNVSTAADHCEWHSTDLSNNAAYGGISGYVKIYNPLSLTNPKIYFGEVFEAIPGPNWYSARISCRYSPGSAIGALTGFKIYVQGGTNIASGTVSVFAFVK